MGLLDTDAEELKKNAAKSSGEGAGSGRKVNQSGLGAFKGLNKYANLTAKYRTEKPAQEPPSPALPPLKSEASSPIQSSITTSITAENPTVEQQRGTNSVPPLTSSPLLNEVSAKSVQSPGEVSAANSLSLSTPEVPKKKVRAKSVLSRFEVSAKSAQSQSQVSSKSVQSQDEVSAKIEQSETQVSAKSVRSQDELSAKPAQSQGEVSAEVKSVFQSPLVEPSLTQKAAYLDEVSAKSVQSQDEVSAATSELVSGSLSGSISIPIKDELKTKSVQSPGEVSANESTQSVSQNSSSSELWMETSTKPSDAHEFTREVLELLEISQTSKSTLATELINTDDLFLTTTKSVQSQCDQGASDSSFDRREPEVLSPEVSAQVSSEVGAYSVQSPSELRAKNEFLNPPRHSSQCEVRSQVRAPVGAKLVRSQCKLEPLESVTALAGAQRIVIEFLFERCLWNNSLVTPPITKQQLREGTQLLEDTALSAVKRLRKKAIIDRYAYKDGQAGWTQYQLADESYRELLHLHQFSAKSVQSQSKVSSQVSSEVSARAPSSSSSFIKEELLKTNTENSAPTSNELPKDWENVDCSALHEIKVFLGKTHIRQIYSRKWCDTAQDLQESIDHFAFFMSNVKPDKAPKEPIAHFMAIMRDGHYYGRPEGYLSAEERSQQSKLEAAEKKLSNFELSNNYDSMRYSNNGFHRCVA